MKSLFNEAELFLIDKWADARLLEDSMEEVRKKYQEIGQLILARVTATHPELDFTASYLTQFWDSGYMGFGKRIWPDGGPKAPTGFYVGNLRLELLASDEEEPPIVYVWVPKNANVDPMLTRSILKAAAEVHSSSEEYQQVSVEGTDEVCMYLPAPSRHDLRSALLDSTGQRFVDLIVKQFDGMARFIPALDKLLLKAD